MEIMENFIEKMLDIGAGVELSCSKEEKEMYFKEAREEYKKHFHKLENKILNRKILIAALEKEIVELECNL